MADHSVYLITGAAGGLGSALANVLLRQQLARRVEPELILLDKSVKKLEKLADELESEFGVQPILMPLDMAGAGIEDYHKVAEAIHDQFGSLKGLFFCQAQFSGLRGQQHTSSYEWLLELQANLGGSQVLLQSVAPLLAAQPDGRVVFCVNRFDQVDKAYWGAYGVAQHAIPALARQWAEELSNTEIRVAVCAPQAMRTMLRAEVWPATHPDSWPLPDRTAEAISQWCEHSKLVAELHTI